MAGMCLAALSLASCDDTYDLSKDIDTSVYVNIDNLTLPTSRVEPLSLSQLVDVDDFEDIDIVSAEDLAADPVRFVRMNVGDYYFKNKSANPTKSVIKVDKVVVNLDSPQAGTSEDLSFEAANFNGGGCSEEMLITGTTVNVESNDVTNEIKVLNWLEGTLPITIDLWYEPATGSTEADMPKFATLEAGMKIKFPKHIHVSGIDDTDFAVADNGSTVVTKHDVVIPRGSKSQLEMNITYIDCRGMKQNDKDKNWGLWEVDLTGNNPGRFLMCPEVEIEGKTMLREEDFTAGKHDVHLTVKSTFQTGSLNLETVNGLFMPKSGYTDIDPVQIADLPSFLTDKDTHIDFADPRITFYYKNEGMKNLTITLLELTAMPWLDGDSLPDNKIVVKELTTTTQNGEDTKTYLDNTVNNVTPSLSKLIENQMPDEIRFKVDKTRLEGTIVLDNEYNVEMEYEMMAPLSFGPNSSIKYETCMDGMNGDIQDMYENMELENLQINVKVDYVNTIPVGMFIAQSDVVVMDAEGNAIDDVEVTVTNANIKAGKPENPTDGKFSIVLKQKAGRTLERFDGLKLAFTAKVDDANANTPLNDKQALHFKAINLSLSGGVNYEP